MRVLFRCDASSQIGFGHMTRCLVLADRLRGRHGAQVWFLTRFPAGASQARAAGFTAIGLDENRDYGAEVLRHVTELAVDVWIGDVRDNLPCEAIAAMSCVRVALDVPGDYRLACDLAFYPPIPAIRDFDWSGFNGRLLMGWDCIVLRDAFQPQQVENRFQLLLTMGGSDPNHQTERLLRLLVRKPVSVGVVVGPGFGDERSFEEIPVAAGGSRELIHQPRDMAALMAASELAVTGFGVTAFELAAMNVPAVYLCHQAHDLAAADFMAAQGFALNAGVYDRVEDAALLRLVSELIHDKARLTTMGRACDVFDNRGADHIADVIAGEVRNGAV